MKDLGISQNLTGYQNEITLKIKFERDEMEKKKLKIVSSRPEVSFEDQFFELGEEDFSHQRKKKPRLNLIKNADKIQSGLTGEFKRDEGKVKKVFKILRLIRGKE